MEGLFWPHLWLHPFSFSVKLCTWMEYRFEWKGISFPNSIGICEILWIWKKMHFNTFYFFFLSIAVVLFSFCFVKRLVIYIVYQKLIHVVFSWHFKQNVAHSSLCLFVFPDPHVHSDIFRLFSFGKQWYHFGIVCFDPLDTRGFYMAWHCIYLIFPLESTAYSWMFHAILLPT